MDRKAESARSRRSSVPKLDRGGKHHDRVFEFTDKEILGWYAIRKMRFAYADPPYLGFAEKFYGDPTYDRIEAHAELIADLDKYDGWVYSLTSTTLKQILPLCPDDVRIGAWVKPFCSFKMNVKPAYAWEPFLFRGGRKFEKETETPRDWIAANITLQKGLVGAKPLEFSFYIFRLLNMTPADEFIDVFLGSGEVTRAWQIFSDQYADQGTLFQVGGEVVVRA